MNPLVRSRAPIQIEQGDADTTVFKVYTDQLKNELIAAGSQVIYKTYPRDRPRRRRHSGRAGRARLLPAGAAAPRGRG
jgi:hypothetical protein